MSAIITGIKKCEGYSNDKPFAVLTFKKAQSAGSKLAVGCLTNGSSYSATYNLAVAYADCTDEDKKFSAKLAWKTLNEDYSLGSTEEGIECYDIAISEISDFERVKIVSSGREMSVMHPAVYGTREDAKAIAKRSLERQLKQKTLKPITDADDDDDDDE